MPLIVPVASLNAKSSQTVALDDVVYRLTFVFNTRCLAWDMTVAEQDGTVLVAGIKLVPMIELLFRHKDVRLPKGRLFAIDVEEGEDATRIRSSKRPRRISVEGVLFVLSVTATSSILRRWCGAGSSEARLDRLRICCLTPVPI